MRTTTDRPNILVFLTDDHAQWAVRCGDWKLHLTTGELYDLKTDVAESADRAADRPEVAHQLRALVDEARADLGDELTRLPDHPAIRSMNCCPIAGSRSPNPRHDQPAEPRTPEHRGVPFVGRLPP